jgi:hypothetical protein
MRSFCFYGMGGTVLGGLIAMLSMHSSGCVQGQGQCPRPIGQFHASYNVVNGNCTSTIARDLTLSKDDKQNTISMAGNLSEAVTTEVNLIGCTIGVTQHITDPMGTKHIADLEGELTVQDESALVGTMNYVQYMPDGITQQCHSQVSASYTLGGASQTSSSTAIGAAAQHALSTPAQ